MKPKYVRNIIENVTRDHSFIKQFKDTKLPLTCYLIEVCSNLDEQEQKAALDFHNAKGHSLNYHYST